MRSSLFIAAFFLALQSPPTAAVDPPSQWKIRCACAFKNWILPWMVPNLSQAQDIQAVDYAVPGRPYQLKLHIGERLGFGLKGAVYIVNRIEGDHPELAKYQGLPVKFVLKTSHQGRTTGLFKDRFQKILAEERFVYDSLMKSLTAVESDDEWYPKNAHWARGTLPVAPILASVDLGPRFGIGLIKLFVPGKSVQAIAREFRDGELEQSTIEHLTKSITDWYDFSQAASNHVYITPLGATAPRLITSIDINPENMVYVDDPLYLKLLGVQNGRPTVMAYELGEPALTAYHHTQLSKDQYRIMWINFIKGIQ